MTHANRPVGPMFEKGWHEKMEKDIPVTSKQVSPGIYFNNETGQMDFVVSEFLEAHDMPYNDANQDMATKIMLEEVARRHPQASTEIIEHISLEQAKKDDPNYGKKPGDK